ncbi:MAG: hypothetical protein KC421_12305, partial [Anaerolineales bacterium]|nr:hypothetical protein [Anaerolineales bacterium]
FGDILLVQGTWRDIQALRDLKRDFVVMGEPEAMIDRPTRDKARWASIIMIGMLALMIGDILPVA